MAVIWTSGWQLQGNLTFQVVTDEGFSIRIFLKPLVPTISQYQYNTWKKIDRNRENINCGIAWWSNMKFSELTLYEW